MSTTPQTNPETTELATAAAPVANKRTAATGVIPKQMQSWIFLTVVFVGAVGLWFSSSGSTKAAKPRPGAASVAEQVKPLVGGLSPEEVQTRLKESEQAGRNAAANLHPDPPPTTDAQFKATFRPDANQLSTNSENPPQNPAPDPIREDERKREYAGRFASNIALSYRSDSHAGASNGQAPTTTSLPNSNSPGELSGLGVPQSELPVPDDFQQRLSALQAQQEKLLAQEQQQLAAVTGNAATSSTQPQTQPQPASTPARRNTNLNRATGKNHVIFEGSVLEAVLVNRLNGDFAGPV